MFIIFSDQLINTDYIFKFYRCFSDIKDHPRPYFIKLEFYQAEKKSDSNEYFENFDDPEECQIRFEELVKVLALA